MIRWLLVIGILLSARGSAAGAEALPLLPPGLHIGVLYSPPESGGEAQRRLDAAFGEVVQAGASVYALTISWADLEKTPGQVDTADLKRWLDILRAVKLRPYLGITTINTVKLTLPDDLMTADETGLAGGRRFDDPLIRARFEKVLDAVVPLLAEYDGFFLAVGNEVDGWLESRPTEARPYVRFVAAARQHVQQLEPRLGVGAVVGQGGVAKRLPVVDDLLKVSDAAVYTYYPLNLDFTVQEPLVVQRDLATLMEAARDKPVLFQEVGYPSGYAARPGNHSSPDQQKQFFEQFFAEAQQYPQLRFASVLQLSDWSPAVCDAFVRYYTNLDSLPLFHEYLCSLGIREYDGTPKPAYAAVLQAVKTSAAKRASPGRS